ncbi:MAG TPA: response regulator [Syntrophorhabdaceae bacterium]|nr:response regulator [Syntrophorhabdaceae bacterium]
MMIGDKNKISEVLQSQWDRYEGFLNHYSALVRMLGIVDEMKDPLSEIPKILVEETGFDTCYYIYLQGNSITEGFFSLFRERPDIDIDVIKKLNNNSLFSSVHNNINGYSRLYIYPQTDRNRIRGFIVLGKRYVKEGDNISIKEIDLICNFYNKLHKVFLSRVSETESDGNLLFPEFSLSSHFPYPLIFVDNQGKIVHLNEKARHLLHVDRYPLIGVDIKDIFTGIDFGNSVEQQSKTQELQFKTEDRHFVYEIDIYPVTNNTGDVVYRGIILRDVTELKLMHEASLFREKLETLGMLAAGIAHDFNNMLTGILGYASMLKSSLKGNERLFRYTEVIERSAGRAASLTKQLLNFARKQERPSSEFDLHIVIEDSLLLFCESLKGIEIEKDLSASNIVIEGDESEFQHIFLNLFINAKEAMDGKGLLRVSTRNQSIDGKNYICITVEDTGKGIDEAAKANIFKPHFSTKGTRSNLGIGLYRVHKTIKKYGGFIEVESEKDKGTRFFLYIPCNDNFKNQTVVIENTKEGNRESFNRKKVLVVDDEEFIGEMFALISERIGADVVYCNNGHDALNHIRDNKFDCVVLDIIMPGMKGDEVLARIRQMGIDVDVIVSSGYMSEDQRDRVKQFGVKYFLDKPFTDQKILDSLEAVLFN